MRKRSLVRDLRHPANALAIVIGFSLGIAAMLIRWLTISYAAGVTMAKKQSRLGRYLRRNGVGGTGR